MSGELRVCVVEESGSGGDADVCVVVGVCERDAMESRFH